VNYNAARRRSRTGTTRTTHRRPRPTARCRSLSLGARRADRPGPCLPANPHLGAIANDLPWPLVASSSRRSAATCDTPESHVLSLADAITGLSRPFPSSRSASRDTRRVLWHRSLALCPANPRFPRNGLYSVWRFPCTAPGLLVQSSRLTVL
jgi:hypothetical protein